MRLLLYYILIINLYGIIIMYYDKRKSRKNQWRVPEARIFLIAFILGSPGVLLGMYLFRHKTKHMKFILGIPIILVIQVYLLSKFIFRLF